MDILCKAENPTGNLLNAGSSDTATIPGNSFELLSNIGLFFKPDKNSILKVNARDYTWEIDTDALTPDTMCIFPDPSKYGDIGNNKSDNYPLLMIYHLDYDIKNISAGTAKGDPTHLIGEVGWHTYFTRQDEILKDIPNYDFEYAFTSLANKGVIQNYQTDIWGNQFGLFKGYSEETFVKDGKTYLKVNLSVDSVTTIEENELPDDKYSRYILLNGGYFEDPRYPALNPTDERQPFPFNETVDMTRSYYDPNSKAQVVDGYKWSGLKLGQKPLWVPSAIYDQVKGMHFGAYNGIKFVDHYGYVNDNINGLIKDESVIYDVLENFVSQVVGNDIEVVIQRSPLDHYELQNSEGCLYIRDAVSFDKKPLKILEIFDWLVDPVYNTEQASALWGGFKSEDIIDFIAIHNTLILQTKTHIIAVPYSYDSETGFDSTLGLKTPIILPIKNYIATKILYNEKEQQFYICVLDKYESGTKTALIPAIYRFNTKEYEIEEAFNLWDSIDSLKTYVENTLRTLEPGKGGPRSANITVIVKKVECIKDYITANKDLIDGAIFEPNDTRDDTLNDFTVSYSYHFDLGNIAFS